MGLFDYYEPVPPLRCPVCATPLTEWQGKQGTRLLFVWRQGQAAAVGFRPDGMETLPLRPDLPDRLPPEFTFYSNDCPRHRFVTARGRTAGGIWTESVLLPWNPHRDYESNDGAQTT